MMLMMTNDDDKRFDGDKNTCSCKCTCLFSLPLVRSRSLQRNPHALVPVLGARGVQRLGQGW